MFSLSPFMCRARIGLHAPVFALLSERFTPRKLGIVDGRAPSCFLWWARWRDARCLTTLRGVFFSSPTFKGALQKSTYLLIDRQCASPTGGGNGAPLARSNERRQTRGSKEGSTGNLGHGNNRGSKDCDNVQIVFASLGHIHCPWVFIEHKPVCGAVRGSLCILQDLSTWPH